MKKLKHKIVFISGASSGIGKATAILLAKQRVKLIIAARRIERLNKLATQLRRQYNIEVLPLVLDVRDKQEVNSVIAGLPESWKAIDILINNAGLAIESLPMQDSEVKNWDTMIDTNIKGLLYLTHAVLAGMVSRNSGHIVNVSSIAGHDYYPTGNIYSMTKHAVRTISKSLRLDLLGKNIRVSDVAPGAVATEFSRVRWNDEQRANDFYNEFDSLQAVDIADAIEYCVTRPKHVDISEIVICPTAQASCNHLHRTHTNQVGSVFQ